MEETVGGTDMGIGLAMVFTVLAVVAAIGMAVTVEQQVVAAWLFAAAMVAGTVAVAAPHLYGGR
jgi:hypothetical protein